MTERLLTKFGALWCIAYCLLHYNRVYPLLGSAQGLALGQQHPFPWYPPVCTSLSDIPEGQRSGDHLKAMKTRQKWPQKVPDTKLKEVRL